MNPKAIKEAYQRGENITELLRQELDSKQNTEEIIETAYDLQTGSYVRALESTEMFEHKQEFGAAIAAEISQRTSVNSILEPGVGEGTTLSFVAKGFETSPLHIHGFDISWSRMAVCRKWLAGQNCSEAWLSVASIFNAPYLDNSFDVVYTSHTIEPNGGREPEILSELYRIASRYLILFEPGYELAGDEARARMDRLGYCRALVEHAETLGMKVVRHELFEPIVNPQNPTAITVISKDPGAASVVPKLACPRYLTPLSEFSDSLFSSESFRAYPKIKGIPCLRPNDGIIASHFEEIEV